MSADDRRAELVEALRPKLGLRQHMAEPLADALLPLVQKIEAELNAKDARIAELEAELKDASDAYWREREQHEADRLAKDTQLAAQAEAMAELDDKATQSYEDRDEAVHRAEQAEALADEHAANARELGERLRQAEAERDQFRAAAERVREMHQPVPCSNMRHDGGNGQHCGVCEYDDVSGNVWPCPTIRALDQAPAAEQDGGGQ